MSVPLTKSHVPTPLYIKRNVGRDYVDGQIASLVYQWRKWRGWSAAATAPRVAAASGEIWYPHINMTFFFFWPLLNNVSDKNKIKKKKGNTGLCARVSTSEMFMWANRRTACTSSFALSIYVHLGNIFFLFFETVFFFFLFRIYLFPSILHKSSSMRVTGE